MSTEDIKNRLWTERERQALRNASAAQASGDDSGIDYSDIPRLTDEQLSSLVRLRGGKRKVSVSVRLDPNVLDWLRAKGAGHLTRINDILTNLMEAERHAGAGR
jgi:uncharacterized protein (DUF4415 family)